MPSEEVKRISVPLVLMLERLSREIKTGKLASSLATLVWSMVICLRYVQLELYQDSPAAKAFCVFKNGGVRVNLTGANIPEIVCKNKNRKKIRKAENSFRELM